MTDLNNQPLRLYLVRHGETDWSLSGRHTGTTDLPLTTEGHRQADRLASYFHARGLSHVLTSPRRRARETCKAAGLAGEATTDADLAEWDYGRYEGRTTADIHRERPGWDVYCDGCPGGETSADVAARADRLIARLREYTGGVALFSHGQFGCALAARWIGLPIAEARHFAFDPAAIGILADKPGRSGTSQIVRWNLHAEDALD